VRLFHDGEAKSRRDALRRVSGADDPRFSDAYRRLNKRFSALMREAERAKEIEDNDPRQRKIESFDPSQHKDAEIGTYAFINQNSTDWEKASRAGWTWVEAFDYGEMLIRRDLRGIFVPGSAEMATFLKDCAADFAHIRVN
jgi:hypothetical protein